MLSDLKKIVVIPKEKTNVDICIPLSFDQPINYYRAVNDLTWINTVERNAHPNYLFDYLYLEPDGNEKINTDSKVEISFLKKNNFSTEEIATKTVQISGARIIK